MSRAWARGKGKLTVQREEGECEAEDVSQQAVRGDGGGSVEGLICVDEVHARRGKDAEVPPRKRDGCQHGAYPMNVLSRRPRKPEQADGCAG